MTEMPERCPECGAAWTGETTCQDHFYQMLYWEAEFPEYGVVHHLMVLCYHLQHPHLYSADGLREGLALLVDFVARGISPAEVLLRDRSRRDSGKRQYSITSRPDSRGEYANPVTWTMTAADVVAAGAEQYTEQVRAWSRSMYEALAEAGSLAS